MIYSFPVTIENGVYKLVEDLELSDYDQAMIKRTGDELLEERAAVADILG